MAGLKIKIFTNRIRQACLTKFKWCKKYCIFTQFARFNKSTKLRWKSSKSKQVRVRRHFTYLGWNMWVHRLSSCLHTTDPTPFPFPFRRCVCELHSSSCQSHTWALSEIFLSLLKNPQQRHGYSDFMFYSAGSCTELQVETRCRKPANRCRTPEHQLETQTVRAESNRLRNYCSRAARLKLHIRTNKLNTHTRNTQTALGYEPQRSYMRLEQVI